MSDSVNHPSHYKGIAACPHCNGEIEAIVITERFNFNLGNSLKYILRAGKKSSAGKSIQEKEIEDLKKARWYLDREINNRSNE